MPTKVITMTQDETFTGGLCLGGDRTREQLHSLGASRHAIKTRGMRCWSGPCRDSTVG
jgi:hypothetical protein